MLISVSGSIERECAALLLLFDGVILCIFSNFSYMIYVRNYCRLRAYRQFTVISSPNPQLESFHVAKLRSKTSEIKQLDTAIYIYIYMYHISFHIYTKYSCVKYSAELMFEIAHSTGIGECFVYCCLTCVILQTRFNYFSRLFILGYIDSTPTLSGPTFTNMDSL